VAVIAQLIRPSSDQVHIRVDMNKEDMDSFVFCLATKKCALRLAKDMADLVSYLNTGYPESRFTDILSCDYQMMSHVHRTCWTTI
jgi:hypothetical protein